MVLLELKNKAIHVELKTMDMLPFKVGGVPVLLSIRDVDADGTVYVRIGAGDEADLPSNHHPWPPRVMEYWNRHGCLPPLPEGMMFWHDKDKEGAIMDDYEGPL